MESGELQLLICIHVYRIREVFANADQLAKHRENVDMVLRDLFIYS